MENQKTEKPSWFDKPLSDYIPSLTIESLFIALILFAALITRLYGLGDRVMSHDEVNHVVPSWQMYEGESVYRHDPITHGPLQFHLIAFSYFLFGDNDFTSRLPHALFNIATIAFVIFAFRRYLGRLGSLFAGFLILISPYMLFYGRYARNDTMVIFFMALMFYAVWRYLETGNRNVLFLLTVSLVFQFTLKEVAYIHAAQLLLFLAVLYFNDLSRTAWERPEARQRFVILVSLLAVFVLAAAASALWMERISDAAPTVPVVEGETAVEPAPGPDLTLPRIFLIAFSAAGLASLVLGALTAIRGLGWQVIRSFRNFDMLMLTGSLILPLLVAFPVRLIGWDPLDYGTTGMLRTGAFLIVMFLLSIAAGLWWNMRAWTLHAGLFWGIFIIFFTTFFTNTQGFFTGLVGGLGYWLEQQGVERGSQPFYYYALVQIPLYEYLPAIGSIIAGAAILRKKLADAFSRDEPSPAVSDESPVIPSVDPAVPAAPYVPVLSLLFYWAITALLAYSYAGEKMPQMTLYPVLPMILITAWAVARIVQKTDWRGVLKHRGMLVMALLPVFLAALSGLFGSLLGAMPPFQGNTLEELQATNQFILSFLAVLSSLAGIFWLGKDWSSRQVFSLAALTVFLFAALLTARTAYTASYVNYDTAKEYLTYAHAARGPKDVLEQVEEISRRTTSGLDVMVAYDSDGLYPYWWYFRDYPNHRWYGDNPTRDLRDYPLIIASEGLFGKIEPVVQNNYTIFETTRLWWPNQDYFNLTFERVWNAVTDPALRAGVFQIWLNRDYEQYAAATGSSSLTLETWQPANRMRLYIRKDIIADMWEYGSLPAMEELIVEDPYENNLVELVPDKVIGQQGTNQGEFSGPRSVAVAPDGTIYVADQLNHRIQHFSEEGEILHVWGSYGSVVNNSAAAGMFNEPWGVAVGPDGSVYVSDTWNYRIQKFTPDGQFIMEWGYSGQGESAAAFYGPRGLAVDANGNVYVADTGNKRIVVFTSTGEYVTEFGEPGMELGQLDEPVDVALDAQGNVYVSDTWNQRVHVFAPTPENRFFPVLTWEINGWFSQSIDNKPYIAVDSVNGYVFVTDPEGYRVLQFDLSGNFIRGWGDYSPNADGFGLPIGIAVDQQGRVWVTDATNNRVLRFDLSGLPAPVEVQPEGDESFFDERPFDEPPFDEQPLEEEQPPDADNSEQQSPEE